MAEREEASGKYAYATLLTRPSYLAGALLLACTLHKHSPSTPLVILYTPETLPESSIQAVRAEAKYSNIILHPVDHLRLTTSSTGGKDDIGEMVAERFIDTWTKLRVFELHELEYEYVCFLDADMMIFSDPSPPIFNDANFSYLAGEGGGEARLMATHVCVCNLDHDSWAPSSWTPANCAYNRLSKSSAPPPVTHKEGAEDKHDDTKGIFNSGTFLFRNLKSIRDFVFSEFDSMGVTKLRSMKFPDQDFLNAVFTGRWSSLPWSVNALKTWRYWHDNIWDDEKVAVLHYIVDKPWAKRVGEDGKAGYRGDDGETHSWWWNEYERWVVERQEQREMELVGTTSQFVASADGQENEEMRAIGGGAQNFAKKWEGEEEGELPGAKDHQDDNDEDAEKQTYGEGSHGPILRKPMLGERGHGPVVRRGARGRGAFGSALAGRGRGLMDP
ncbi:nucleotide-diphospho-sugar transferase [Lophiotrema nucula]|uniref:Nucleotide-diphospho-sugar transferase n=1 Tax=Lophiotrema nucula TaxID=690887 RepID=A0A6A5Z5N0_9PLEO|nr:nucleotide-diphospho-sugar transferase [Lophiotrema nucula]